MTAWSLLGSIDHRSTGSIRVELAPRVGVCFIPDAGAPETTQVPFAGSHFLNAFLLILPEILRATLLTLCSELNWLSAPIAALLIR